MTAKNIVVNGETKDFGSKSFTSPAVTDLWELQISTLDASLLADGSDNTEVTFKLVDKVTGEVDKTADNVVLDLNTTYGTLASKRVTVQDGVATVLITSEFSNVNISAKIDAQIIEASGDHKDLINHVVGSLLLPFKTTTTENVETVTLVSAEANQADRVTLFFDKEISLKHFVATNSKGELLYTQSGVAGDKVAKDLENVNASLISHKLINNNNVKITQGSLPFNIKGFKPVAGNSKAIEVILDKTTSLKDNADVKIDVITVNSLKKETNSSSNFTVTDARKPEATSVNAEGLNTLKVKFSEAIDESTFQIDGQFKGVRKGSVAIDAAPATAALANKDQAFTYEFGEFNPATLADNRDLATITLTAHYWESGDKKLSGFFGAGAHAVQASSTKDFAFKTDPNNIGSTQNLNFNIAADSAKPTATVTVESPEQFRLKFDKAVTATEAQVQAFITTSDKVKLQVKDATTGNYVDAESLVASKGKVAKATDLKVTQVSSTEFIIELTKDWTEIHDTTATNKNYYNYEYRLLIAKETFTNIANGLQNDELQLNLNTAGSVLNTPDTTSPVIAGAVRVGTSNELHVTMSEPVKLVNGTVLPAAGANLSRDNAGDTIAQGQGVLAKTTVQFLGKDKDGKTVTINGNVGDYVDAGKGLDSKFAVNWTVGGTTVTPQTVVDEGGSTEWTVVVRAISDDVGNTAASATYNITLDKSAAGNTPFFVEVYATGADAGKHKVEGKGNDTIAAPKALDTVEITFSEGVQFSGNSDATNPANYTLNGVTLPTGTSISVSDKVVAAKGLETVTITLPDGTLNIGATVSNVITINKNLISHDGSKIERDTTVHVNMAENNALAAAVSVARQDLAGAKALAATTASDLATATNAATAAATAVTDTTAEAATAATTATNAATAATNATGALTALIAGDADKQALVTTYNALNAADPASNTAELAAYNAAAATLADPVLVASLEAAQDLVTTTATAKTAADAAKVTADAAVVTATTAKTNADAAVVTATTAKTNADLDVVAKQAALDALLV
ncbi:hypothetical protein [Sporosarcina sp. FSL K6-5500]|uniref:hypothetical protein n=1 Tax=Sporosarcina sp. FSL K6-5500 TaxID=2921558 RepID=UPI0030F952B2